MNEKLIHAKISDELYENLISSGKFRNFDGWLEQVLKNELKREGKVEILNLKEGVENEPDSSF
jgi:hypothetical protein